MQVGRGDLLQVLRMRIGDARLGRRGVEPQELREPGRDGLAVLRGDRRQRADTSLITGFEPFLNSGPLDRCEFGSPIGLGKACRAQMEARLVSQHQRMRQ